MTEHNPILGSGLPLRRDFSGGLFYTEPDLYRVIDLKHERERFVSHDSIEQTLGGEKWKRVKSELDMHGYFERGDYRIEHYYDPEVG